MTEQISVHENNKMESVIPRRIQTNLRTHRYRCRMSNIFWTLCFVVVFCTDSSLTYRFEDEDSDDISTNELLPPLASSYSSSSSSSSTNHHSKNIKVFFQSGVSEESLPVCSPNSVCNKVDTYGSPWVEKQCTCPGKTECSTSTHSKDGHTVVDRNRQYKMCEPTRKLKRCKYFKDITWTYITYPDNSTQQVLHCKCPKNSVAYLIKRHAYETGTGTGFQYSFACSPQTKLRCQRKEPCRLFSVRKNPSRPSADEVSTSSLCQCPHRRKCPKHHLDVGVIPGKVYSDDSVRTYSGYCM